MSGKTLVVLLAFADPEEVLGSRGMGSRCKEIRTSPNRPRAGELPWVPSDRAVIQTGGLQGVPLIAHRVHTLPAVQPFQTPVQ